MLQSNNQRCRKAFLQFCVMVVVLATTVLAEEMEEETYDDPKNRVYKPKLWFLKEANVFGVTLPLSPLSIFMLLLLTVHFFLNWGTYSWCEASHILIKVHSPEAKIALKELRDEIGSDLNKFQEMAKKHSDCPSGRKFL